MKRAVICLIVSCFLLFGLTACSAQKPLTDNTESGTYTAASSEASAEKSKSEIKTSDEEISADVTSDVSVTTELQSGDDTPDEEAATSKSESATSSAGSKGNTSSKAESTAKKTTVSSSASGASAYSKPSSAVSVPSAERPSIPTTSSTPSKPAVPSKSPSAGDLTTSSKPSSSSGSSSGSPSSKPTYNTSSVDSEAQKQEVLKLVNEERAKNGLAALSYRYDLQEAADIRAKETVTSFSHTRPDGRSCFTVLADAGISYRSVGENIAYGYKDASSVMTGWMNSSGHRANILKENFKGLAVGLYEQNNTKYWVQIFIQ